MQNNWYQLATEKCFYFCKTSLVTFEVLVLIYEIKMTHDESKFHR